MKTLVTRRRRRFRLLFVALALIFFAAGSWTWWSESHPHQERQLRTVVQDQLQTWFPEEMRAPPGDYGLLLYPSDAVATADRQDPLVILVHGLDEPGGIWGELIPVLLAHDFAVAEFRYPNDQAVDRSTDLLAEQWPTIPADQPVILVGHSMGGLVIRDFVSRWRDPVGTPARVTGAPVRGVILVGTPNQGSEWARLRVWLELRDYLAEIPEKGFSLFAGLRDGTGAAKIDLRPGSDFLLELNARPWPDAIPVRIIGGALLDPTPKLQSGFEALFSVLNSDELTRAILDWWSSLGEDLGDGVVAVTALEITGAPEPVLVSAAHRGLLVRLLTSDPEPPAIAPILDWLHEWRTEPANPAP